MTIRLLSKNERTHFEMKLENSLGLELTELSFPEETCRETDE